MGSIYDYDLAKKFNDLKEKIYNKYKYSNNHKFYYELSNLIQQFPIHVLTDFDNTFVISTEYKLFYYNVRNAFKKKNLLWGIKEIFNLMGLYLQYKFGGNNLGVILQNLFDKDICRDNIKNIIYNTDFKKQGFELLLKLKASKDYEKLNIIVISRNSMDLVDQWIKHNRRVLAARGLQIVGAIANKIEHVGDYQSGVVLNPIIDTKTKIKIFPSKLISEEKLIWVSDKEEQSLTGRLDTVKSYFV